MKVLVRVLTVLFFLLLAGAAAGVIVYFSLQAGGVSFYVEQGDERYYSGTGGKELFLQRGDTYEFSIKSLTGENVDYSVRVLSNAEDGSYNYLGTHLFDLKVTLTGTYSTYTNSTYVEVGSIVNTAVLSDVEIDEGGIIF